MRALPPSGLTMPRADADQDPPDPMYAGARRYTGTMICDRVRTEAFRRAIDCRW